MFLLNSRILVLLQVLLSASLVLTARPTFRHTTAISLCLFGIAIGTWALLTMGAKHVSVMPEPRNDGELITAGPYHFIRHPMYTSLWLACLGLALAPLAIWKLIALVLLGVVLSRKASKEESLLENRFSTYHEYQARTKRFIPFVW